MTLPKINPTTTKSWELLENSNKEENIKTLFESNINRAQDFSICYEDFYIGHTDNRVYYVATGFMMISRPICSKIIPFHANVGNSHHHIDPLHLMNPIHYLHNP